MPVHATPHPPEHDDGIELARPRFTDRPARPPPAQHVDHALELPTRARERVHGSAAVRSRAALDDARLLEAAQPLHEERARDPGKPAIELVEAMDAGQELPNDEGRPAISQDLQSPRDRTVLTVEKHPRTSPGPRPSRSPVRYLYWLPAAPPAHARPG